MSAHTMSPARPAGLLGGFTAGRAALTGPLLVATEGNRDADAAVRVAAALAGRCGTEPSVITVLQPLPLYDAGFAPDFHRGENERVRGEQQLERVRRQVEEVLGDGVAWPIEFAMGRPAAAIASAATQLDASLIVLGIGRHLPVDRLLGGETALHVIRQARTPVYAVSPLSAALPERILVATDFSRTSLEAARLATALVAPGGLVHLIHVIPPLDATLRGVGDWRDLYLEGVRKQFERFEQALGKGDDVEIEKLVLDGDPIRELLAYAESFRADLIAAGSHGHTFLDRLLVGSVATRLLRSAHASVLIAPPGSVAA
jgi:nucleotide-binding universal stress UspA family protein